MELGAREAARACGKVILLGEHAVVYGFPALAAGLPGGLDLRVRPLPDANAPTRLVVADWELDLLLKQESEHPVTRAAIAVFEFFGTPARGHLLEGRSTLPSRAGLGSSAALCVALARLLAEDDADDDVVVAASLAGERVFHGQPSGIDSHVAARGGVLGFVKHERPRPIALGAPLDLIVAPSGISRSTAEQITIVAERRARRPGVTGALLEAIGETAIEGERALVTGDLAALGELMDMAHALLGGIGVSNRRLDELASVAREGGALGAKLTGAGGGGSVIALCRTPDRDRIIESFAEIGCPAFAVTIQP